MIWWMKLCGVLDVGLDGVLGVLLDIGDFSLWMCGWKVVEFIWLYVSGYLGVCVVVVFVGVMYLY